MSQSLVFDIPTDVVTLPGGSRLLAVFDENWNRVPENLADLDHVLIVRDDVTMEVTVYTWLGEDEIISLPMLEGESDEMVIGRVRRIMHLMQM